MEGLLDMMQLSSLTPVVSSAHLQCPLDVFQAIASESDVELRVIYLIGAFFLLAGIQCSLQSC